MWLSAALVTCPRPKRYVDLTLKSYLREKAAPKLHVFADGQVRLPVDKRIVLETSAVVARSGPAYLHSRLNAARSFTFLGTQGLAALHLEDDAELARGWLEQLELAYDEARREAGGRFLLTLYAAFEGAPIKGRHYLRQYNARVFRGNVGLCVPPRIARELGKALSQPAPSADRAVHRYLHFSRTPVFQTRPHLVQHLGDVSTTGLRRIIRSPAFGKR